MVSVAINILSFDQGRASVILQMNMKISTSSCTCLHVIRAFYIVTAFN